METPYWLNLPYVSRKNLTGTERCAVAVVGGGITGVSVAYHLATQGIPTILIEKETVAGCAAGRNGGMVVEGTDLDFSEMVERFGTERARSAWEHTLQARKEVERLIAMNGIACDLERKGSLFVASDEEQRATIEREAAARREAGIPCVLLQGEDLPGSGFIRGLYNPSDMTLHPVKYVRALAEAAERAGCRIYEHTPASSYTATSVKTPEGQIIADHVVLAIEQSTPEAGARPRREQAIVTAPLPADSLAALRWEHGNMLWESIADYYSLRRIGERIFICNDVPLDADEEMLAKHREGMLDRIASTLAIPRPRIAYHWTGILIQTPGFLPTIRCKDGVYEVFGHSGNGLTQGTITGKILAEHLLGKPIPDIYLAAPEEDCMPRIR